MTCLRLKKSHKREGWLSFKEQYEAIGELQIEQESIGKVE